MTLPPRAAARPLNVLHAYKVDQSDVQGGIPQVIASLAALAQDNIEGRALVARSRGRRRDFVSGGLDVTAVASLGTLASTPLAPAYPFMLHGCARRADILVHHAPFPLTDIALLKNLPAHVALIVHWHAEIVGRRVLRGALAPAIRRTLARADRVVVAHESAIAHSDLLGPHARKCVVIPYGIDTGYWSTLDANEVAEVAALRQRHPRLVAAIGRAVDYKGYDVLIDAMKAIDACAIVVGEGPLRESLAARAESEGMSGRLQFLGRRPRNEIKILLHAARVLAFPSITAAEAFGLAQLEAMAAARPVVNTTLPTAVPFVARHGREALTVPAGDAAALSHALRSLIDDPALAAKMGAAGQIRVRAEYDQRVFLARMADLYRAVAAERASARPTS